MYREKRTSSFERKKKKNTGFYIALAICVVTVAAAAWTTYGSVKGSDDVIQESTEASELPAGNDISGEDYSSQESGEEESDQSGNEDSSGTIEESAEPVNGEEAVQEEIRCFPIEDGKVLKEYSTDKPLFSKTTSDWRTHMGVDISANEGSAVRSITDGVVKSVKKSPMFGNTVCIEYGSYEISYCGMSETPVVSEGNNVKAGDTIGYSGTVPCELLDDPHIHIEVKLDGKSANPEILVLNK